MLVLCVLYSKDTEVRMKYKEKTKKKKFHPGHGCLCCVRCTVKRKGKMQDNKDKETTSDDVETE